MENERRMMTHSRWYLTVCVLLAMIMIVASCSDTPTSPDAEPDGELNLEALTAETESGTLQAWRVDNSFVGPIDEGQAIGIAFLEDIAANDADHAEDEIIVILYERQAVALMIGEIDAYGEATLESVEGSDFGATVELVVEDAVVSGTVIFRDEPPAPFAAEPATGVGGVYWAHGTDENPDARAYWVVLPDERQWGVFCTCLPGMPGFPWTCCVSGR